jgi:hypothetical protein
MGLAALDEQAVAVSIGGREHGVGPLRVRHLAALERRVLESRVDPLPRLPAALEGLSERQQELLLGRVYDALSRAPRVSDGELEEFLETRAGFAEALWLCACDNEPRLDRKDLLEALDALPADELSAVRREALRAMRIPWGNGRGQAADSVG